MLSGSYGYGTLAICAVCLSLFSDKGRRAALSIMAGMLCLNWLNFSLSWGDNSLAALLWKLGEDRGWYWLYTVQNYHVWEFLDAVCCVTALAFWYWSDGHDRNLEALWLYVLFLAQMLLHAIFWDGGLIPNRAYYAALDGVLLMQIFVFFYAGGKGFGDAVVRASRWGRDLLRPLRAASGALSKWAR